MTSLFRAAQAGIKTRFTTVADLAAETNHHAYPESAEGRHPPGHHSYRLLIIDEIGYLPMSREQANLFFQVIAPHYEKASEAGTQSLN